MISEFDVREVGGVRARMGSAVGSVVLTEFDEAVEIRLPAATPHASLTVDQARKLARQLTRLAKRVADRNDRP